MVKKFSAKVWICAMLAAFLAVTGLGCGNKQLAQPPRTAGQNDNSAAKVVRIGVLPIEDNLPFYVAEKEGWFPEAGLQVELVSFPSAVERDAALQAGQIDGEVADLVAVALMKKAGTDVKIASIGLGATPQEGRFALLAAPNSSIRQAEDLKNVPIGVSENSIIDYVTDQMLKDRGVPQAQIKKIGVAKMPVRLQMLLSNQIQAACLPDPLATLAVAQGAHLVLDDTYRNISQTVLLFRTASVQNKRAALQTVVRVYGEAGRALAKNPELYRPLLIEKAQIPAPIKDTYKMPTFSPLQLPTQAEVSSVMQWMVEKKLLAQPFAYDELVDPDLLSRT